MHLVGFVTFVLCSSDVPKLHILEYANVKLCKMDENKEWFDDI